MNTKDKQNPKHWTQEERDRIVGLFDLLLKMDKKQNPESYKTNKLKDGVVLDSRGREVTL